jgi:hypothetical protein
MANGEKQVNTSGDRNLPVPDPTRLTTQAVDRAIRDFEKLSEARGLVTDTRLNAMDQATKLVAADVARILAVTESATTHLREDVDRQQNALREFLISYIDRVADVSSEKFAGIDTRFLERDARTAQAAEESRISLDAALAAAKEAVSEQNKANTLAIGKSEAATQKQIDAMAALMATTNKSLEDKINDIKIALAEVPGKQAMVSKSDTVAERTDRRLDYGQIATAVLVLIAIITLVIKL